VRAGGAARGAAQGDDLASTNAAACSDFDLRKMHVDAHETETMVDDDAASFEVELVGEDDPTGVDGGHRGVEFGVIVQAAVDAGDLAVEEALVAEGVGLGRQTERRKEVAGP
jgi:hypothetical protein